MSGDTYKFYLKIGNLRYVLREGGNSIGRNKSKCFIHLHEEYIGRIHTNIIVNGDQCCIELSTGHPIRLNGREFNITTEGALVKIDLLIGDFITIYEYDFQLVEIVNTNYDLNDTDRE